MPKRYKPIEECRQEIKQYARHLNASTDDNDPAKKGSRSTRRYKQDIRWFDAWLDEEGIESVNDVTEPDAANVGYVLTEEFNGTTPRYRWDRIHAFFDWLVRMNHVEVNPFDRWNADKTSEFGLTKSTEQSRQLEEGEDYAPSQDEVRLMEKNVTRHRIRDQLIIRSLWQTGLRRDELSNLELRDIDRDAREVTVRASIAKNDKKRVVGYQPNLDGLLNKWIDGGDRDRFNIHDLPYLFIGERGGQMSGKRINEIVRDAAIQAGINRKLDYTDANGGERWLITAHNLRHGFGNYLINETDAGPWEVSKQMGHSSVKVTEKIYVDDDPRAGLETTKRYGPE